MTEDVAPMAVRFQTPSPWLHSQAHKCIFPSADVKKGFRPTDLSWGFRRISWLSSMINRSIKRRVMLWSYLIARNTHTRKHTRSCPENACILIKAAVGECVSKANRRGWLGSSQPRRKLVSLEQGYSSEGHGETGFQLFSKGLCLRERKYLWVWERNKSRLKGRNLVLYPLGNSCPKGTPPIRTVARFSTVLDEQR